MQFDKQINPSSDMSSPARSRVYSSPKLQELGSVRQLTLGGTGSKPENGQGVWPHRQKP